MNWAIYIIYKRFLCFGFFRFIESRLKIAYKTVRFIEKLFLIRLLTYSIGIFFSGLLYY